MRTSAFVRIACPLAAPVAPAGADPSTRGLSDADLQAWVACIGAMR